MEKKLVVYWPYLWKTVKWMLGNAIFGVFPLLFLSAVYYCSDKKLGGDDIVALIHEGVVVFVCIAIIGGVLVDFYLSGVRLLGFARFATYMYSLVILFYNTVNYLLVRLKIIDKSRFALTSNTTLITIVLSALYIIFVKTNLYMKEDVHYEHIY